MAQRLHILTPIASDSPEEMISKGLMVAGDWVADFRRFPALVYAVNPGEQVEDITADLIDYPDYWTVARTWLADVSKASRLEDHLSIGGFGFWWTLNSQSFVPGLGDLGNVFVWIDLLQAVQVRRPDISPVIHGEHQLIMDLARQIFNHNRIEIIDLPLRDETQSAQRGALVVVRLVIGVVYLIYSIFRRPDICFVSNTNLLREVGPPGNSELRDIYLDDVANGLRRQGWRVHFIEKYGQNASWRGLGARGLFFPNDLLFFLSAGFWSRIGLRRAQKQRWLEKWKAVERRLPTHMQYQGCDLSQFMIPVVRQEFVHHGPALETMLGFWKRILGFWKPKLIYVNNSYSHSAWPIIVAAKVLGIPSIEQQHGLIGRNHLAYLVPEEIAPNTEFALCDVMVTWGEFTRRFLLKAGFYAPGQVVVCGFPRIDSLLRELSPREDTLNQLAIAVDSRVVLYTSNGFAQGFMDDMLDSIAGMGGEGSFHWIIKLHPREKTEAAWLAAIAERKLKNMTVLRQYDFYTLLKACDIHVSFASTTIIEAAVLGKLNLGFKPAHTTDPAGFLEAGAYYPVEPDMLGECLSIFLGESERRQELLREQAKFARDACLHDGRAVSRIVDLIERLIEGNVYV